MSFYLEVKIIYLNYIIIVKMRYRYKKLNDEQIGFLKGMSKLNLKYEAMVSNFNEQYGRTISLKTVHFHINNKKKLLNVNVE